MSVGTQKAGWAETDITPPLGILLGGRGMAGVVAESVNEPLLAQALTLEDANGERMVLVSLDLIGLGPALHHALRLRVAEETGVPPHHVFINCSHTHSGPMTYYEGQATFLPKPESLVVYEQVLAGKLGLLTAESVRRLEPAEVRLHTGASKIGINRRRRMPDGRTEMRPNVEGFYNPEIFLLEILAVRGGGRCLAFSHGCHPVIEYKWNPTLLSPDFPGETRRSLKRTFGGGTHVQYFQACAGNVKPRLLADLEKGAFRRSEEDDARKVGEELAGDVERALCGSPQSLRLRLAATESWFMAPKDGSVRYSRERLKDMAEKSAKTARKAIAGYWLECFDKGLKTVVARPWPAGMIALSPDCRIAWMASEVFAEWQPFLRRSLDDEDLVVWGYMHQGIAGYLPTEEILPEGGYEVEEAPLFGRLGPEPLGPGLNRAVEKTFQWLRRDLDSRLQR